MGKEDESVLGEAPPSYDSTVRPSAGYPPPPSGYAPPQSGYPPPQSGYPPPQSGYPPPQSGYPPPQSGYPPPQSGYPPPQSGYPPPHTGDPSTVIQAPQPLLGVQAINQSSCNGCNAIYIGAGCCATAKCGMFMFFYLITAVIIIIVLAATMKPFPEGPFPQAAIIPFVVFTIGATLMFYIPRTIQKCRSPHTCDKDNGLVCF